MRDVGALRSGSAGPDKHFGNRLILAEFNARFVPGGWDGGVQGFSELSKRLRVSQEDTRL
jgi:hypothetical protein